MLKKINSITFAIVFLLALFAIVYKAFTIPITHDEVSTVVHYSNFNIWQIMMFPDDWPNNHILNTLIVKFLIGIFGKEVWVIRIPNILSFIVYSFAIFRLLNTFFKENSIFIIAAISLFIANAYLLDFFGLCRGYGMATALVTLSSSYLLTGFQGPKDKDIWLAFIFSILASYANFSTLIFWIAVNIISTVYFLTKYFPNTKLILKNLCILVIASLGYLALIITPLIKMTSTDQFKYWSSNGFYKDTILSLVDRWKSNDRLLSDISVNTIGILIILIFVLVFIQVLKNISEKKKIKKILKDKLTIVFLILSLTILVNLTQILVLHSPNLNGRVGLFLYPLFSILILPLLEKLEKTGTQLLKYSVAIVIPIFLFYHLSNTFSFKSVYEWWYDASTLEVIDYLKKENPEDIVTLKTQWWFYPSFYFYTSTGKAPKIELKKYDNTKTQDKDKEINAEYYYIMDSEVKLLEPKFKKVKRFGWDRWLMKKK